MSAEDRGKIITFYSYKGGTGRSMALANVAWVLAAHGKRVLAIDWDLEAPGLHRYFRPFLIDEELLSSEGLIDYVWTLSRAALAAPSNTSGSAAHEDQTVDLNAYITRLNWEFGPNACLDLIPAGRQGDVYAERVNAFDWVNFYERLHGGAYLNRMRRQIRQEYDYVLIDSRTGVSDTSGVCTVQMPDAVVVLFTLNNQSIHGAEAVASSIQEQRPELKIFPVVTRIDDAEQDKLNAGLRLIRELYEPYLNHLDESARQNYWADVEYRYVPYYAYEEVLAPFADARGRNTTLLATSRRLAQHITKEPISEVTWIPEEDRQRVLQAYSRRLGEKTGKQAAADATTHDRAAAPAQTPAPKVSSEKQAPTSAEPSFASVRSGSAAAPDSAARSMGAWARSPGLWFLAAGAVAIAFLLLVVLRPLESAFPTGNAQLDRLYDVNAAPSARSAAFLSLYESGHLDFADVILDSAGLNRSAATGPEFDLSHLNFSNAWLRGANLRGAVLDSADLSGADLSGADLTGASLVGSDLNGATVDGTMLDGANLNRAILEGVDLQSASTNSRTILADGTAGPYRVDEDINLQPIAAAMSTEESTGFVWIGNYDRKQGLWEKVMLARGDGRAVSADPARLSAGEEYVVAGDLNLRANRPANDSAYFRNVVKLGVLARGSTVELLEPPVEVDRNGSLQYWAYVRVVDSDVNQLERLGSSVVRRE